MTQRQENQRPAPARGLPWRDPARGPIDDAAARTAGLTMVYGEGAAQVVALDGVDATFARGRFTAIMGASGSGKSTLLHCAAGLERPTSGEVWIGGVELTSLDDTALTTLRRDRIGFVFQEFNLLPTLTAKENITLPFDLAGRRADPDAVAGVAAAVGIGDRLDHLPSQLSGGQRQRVACARALVTEPEVVFADEPTGALDSRNSAELMRVLRHGVDANGSTVVMVTHDPTAAAHADHVLFLADGDIVGDLPDPTADLVMDTMKTLEGARC
jgi:putative ABC transport system ATP-binding protein